MSGPTGPWGQQGQQGFKGPRGITGITGFGYGLTTGPTGGIGNASMVNTTISSTYSQTITVTIATSGKIYNLSGMTGSGAIIYFDYSSLGADDAGAFWMFHNSTEYNINGSGTSLYVGPGQSATYVWTGTSLSSI
jgi:hypothetical protein